MLRLLARRSNDVAYFTNDHAHELDGIRDGGPGWWLRGSGDARDARDVSRVLTTNDRSAMYGYDLIFAAPRPISVLLALDPVNAPGVVRAHRVSVRAGVEYLENHSLVVRDRRGGHDRDSAGQWRNVVSFTHGVNRHGEPHLHDHVLVGARPEGSRNVLDSRALYAHVLSADALYRTSLRHELGRLTPWRAWRSFEGVERVVGLDEGYRALWSGHHQGRGEKLTWSRDEAAATWRRDLDQFSELGIVAAPSGAGRQFDEHRFAGLLEGRDRVARRHVLAAWADAATFGQQPFELEQSLDVLYPKLVGARGVREPTMGLSEVRLHRFVREHGPRPLEREAFDVWRQRSRERDRSWDARSR
jgi:hypothetical protein